MGIRPMNNSPCIDNNYVSDHAQLLRNSHKMFTGCDMIDANLCDKAAAKEIFYSYAVILSHNTQADPVLNYINQAGLELFELDWETMLTLPSRLTAEPMEQEARKKLLDKVSTKGYIDDYSGIRISITGRRFKIERATVWNLIDITGEYQGQAAMFSDWEYLD